MRKIIHIDMDCFFAAVEMRDNPALREVPLAIGGAADRRGSSPPATTWRAASGALRHAERPGQKALSAIGADPRADGRLQRNFAPVARIFLRYTEQVEPLSSMKPIST